MQYRFASSRRAHRVIEKLQAFILSAILLLLLLQASLRAGEFAGSDPGQTLAGGIELDSREYKLTDEHNTRTNEIELTLKFRSPDIFLAAGMPLKAKNGARNVDSKIEEDLGPLSVRGGSEGAVAKPRSARSQFSRSTKQTVSPDKVPTSLAGIAALYPSFEDELRATVGGFETSALLEPSPEYRELVYESSKLIVAKDVKTKFALTLWYKDVENQDRPALAEVSFKYDVRNGGVPDEVARRALALLLAMQDLPWADPSAPTKTTLVSCDRPT